MTVHSPEVLLGPAALLLQSHGYATDNVVLSADATMLLAENEYFAIAITEFASPADLAAVEASAASLLLDRLTVGTSAKRWDAYLVLLSTTAQVGEDFLPEAVATIVYDTRYLRRVVKWNVAPDTNSLTDALRAFLPLPSAQATQATSPVERLRHSLVSYGIPDDEAVEAIDLWRAAGQRDA